MKIKWHLRDSDYKFANAGIAFQPAARKVISGCTLDPSDDSFVCDNDTSVSGTFKYTIRVEPKRKGDPTPPPLDPTVVNH